MLFVCISDLQWFPDFIHVQKQRFRCEQLFRSIEVMCASVKWCVFGILFHHTLFSDCQCLASASNILLRLCLVQAALASSILPRSRVKTVSPTSLVNRHIFIQAFYNNNYLNEKYSSFIRKITNIVSDVLIESTKIRFGELSIQALYDSS
jgi:hypothetical protein